MASRTLHVEIYTEKANALAKRYAIQRSVRLANKVQDQAREMLLDHRRIRTGRLYGSIKINVNAGGKKIVTRVGSDLSYAKLVHDGAKAHLIRPRRRRGMKFFWPAGVGNPPLKVGTVVCFKGVVHHSGFRSTRYLLIPLVKEAPKLGFFPPPLI